VNQEAAMTRNVVLICWIVLFSFVLFAQGVAPLVNDPPKGISIPEIIQSFAAKETEFKQALEQYTYTRNVTVTANCQGRQPGVYHLTVDVMIDGKGNPLEKIKALDSTLQCVLVSKKDLDDFRNQSLIVLTANEIPNYQINFVGQQQQDDLHFYVFDVSPVAVQPGKPQFDGRI
jgi:hypothetical protein